jgi:hypothetical protein
VLKILNSEMFVYEAHTRKAALEVDSSCLEIGMEILAGILGRTLRFATKSLHSKHAGFATGARANLKQAPKAWHFCV